MTNDPDEKQRIGQITEALNNVFNPYGGITTGFALLLFDPNTGKPLNCVANTERKTFVDAMKQYLGKKDE